MPTITLRYKNGTTKTFYTIDPELERILTDAEALRPDGTAYEPRAFLGGILLDGCPLNRVLYGYYTAGQKEALDAAGIVCALDLPRATTPPTEPPVVIVPPSAVPASTTDELVPFVQASPIVLVPTGEPTSTIVASVVASIISGIIGIFGRGLPGKVAREIFGLRDAVVQLGREIVRLTQFLARGLQAILGALRTLYDRVLKRAIERIEQINSRIGKIVDRVLGPYLQALQRIRQIILDIYGRFFLPIIEAIQTIRKAISILRVLHVPGMKQLDEKLQRIQAKLIGVITDLLRRTNDHSGLLNVLLTAKMTLQHGTLLGSLYETRRRWISMWWNEQTPLPGTLAGASEAVPSIPARLAQLQSDGGQYVRTGGGPA